LTLKLKDAEFITTEEVVRGKRGASTVKRVEIITPKKSTRRSRKEVTVPEKRDIFDNDLETTPVKRIGRRKKNNEVENKVVQNTPVKPVTQVTETDKPRQQFSAIKR